jgi:hypothetical protein
MLLIARWFNRLKKTIWLLSLLMSILSLSSLVQHLGNVGLAAVFSELISFYRLITYQIYGFIGDLILIKFPPMLMDAWTLSFIGAGAYVNTPNIEKSRLLRNFDLSNKPKYWKSLLFVFMGLSFSGLALLFSALSPQTYLDEMSAEPQDLTRGALKNTLYVLVGTLVFFALNAYAPSL